MPVRRLLPALGATTGVAVAAAAIVMSAGEQPARAGAGGSTGLAALAEDPKAYRGEQVTVTGIVDERYRRGAFAIAGTDGSEVVVVPRRAAKRRPAGTVRVTGRARRVGVDLRPHLGGDYVVRVSGAAIERATVERVEK